jgi:riboflavin-specific deaminase-like protein
MHLRPLLPRDAPGERSLEDWYDAAATSWVRGGFVVTVDGAVAADGSSLPLSSPADKQAFQALRAVSDAVLVGAGTVRAEDYGPVRLREAGRLWRRAHAREGLPRLVVVSRSLELDPAARCFPHDGSTVVLTCAAAPAERRSRLARVAEVVVAGDEQVDLPAAVAALGSLGLRRLHCEGGPALLTDLLRAGLVDELCLTLTPLLVGAAPTLLTATLPAPLPLRLEHLLDAGDGVLLGRWSVPRG